MDGKIAIGTVVDTKGMDDGIKEVERKGKETEEKTTIKAKVQVDESSLDEVSKRIDELQDKASKPIDLDGVKVTGGWNLSEEETAEYNHLLEVYGDLTSAEQESLSNHSQISQTLATENASQKEIDTTIESQGEKLASLEASLTQMVNEYNSLNKQPIIDEGDIKYADELKNDIITTKQEIESMTNTPISIKGITDADNQIKGMNVDLNGVKSTIGNSIKQVGRYALAVFGIRSAYYAVRSAVNILANDNKQLGADIDYMKTALAYTLEPVVMRIVGWARQLLVYLGYIIKMWTGKNIFASADKSLKNANKGAVKLGKTMDKTINRTLAGFDEMNVLQSDSGASGGGDATGGGASGATLPSFDLAKEVEDLKAPLWLQWIAGNKDLILAVMGGVAAGLAAWKLGFKGLESLGIGLAIAGIIGLVESIIKFIKDPSWDNFADILLSLTAILAGVAIAMLAVNAANPVAWIMLAIAAVILLVATIIKNWDSIKVVLGAVGKWVYDKVIKPIADFFKGLWNGIVNGVKGAVNGVKTAFNSVVSFFSGIVRSILNLFRTIGVNVGNVIAGAFKGVINGVLWAIENILNTPIRAINGLIGIINKVPGIKLGKLSTFKLPRLKSGAILNNPGRGVMVGGTAIAGEAGREGIIPLTDQNAMEQLGATIGRYVTINATIPVYAYNRQVDRQVKKIQASKDFLTNN